MKTVKTLIAVSLIGLTSVAYAGNDGHRGHRGAGDHTYTDWARVTSVAPQYERVSVPHRECRVRRVSEYDDRHGDGRSYGGAVLGSIAGGILGNQVGEGQGRTAATAVGAVVGAMVGDRIDNGGYRNADYGSHEREERRCRVIDQWENRLTGYQVEYEYNGRHYSRFMTEDPGRRIPVRVSVEPR